MTDLEIYEEIIRLTRAGERFALATVIETSGSAPRKAGAKMLVRDDGTILGTVGGGRVEAETIQAALTAMGSGTAATLQFALTEDHGFVCGGTLRIYIEPHGGAPRLVMFGAGHVGKAVSSLARPCGFRVTVVDERPELANPRELPHVDEILCLPVAEAFSSLAVTGETYIVIATTGHELDFAVVRGALATSAAFIGLVGSRRKREALARTLEREGIAAAEIDRIVTPVGLPIGAETPAEIAVSIVAQLIEARRNHGVARVGDSPRGRIVAADGNVQAASAP